MFETVIVPLNGSPHAEAAVPYAMDEAREHGAALVLVRVIPRPEPCLGLVKRGGPLPLVPTWSQAELRAAEGEAIRYLHDVRYRFGLGGRAQMVVAVGEPVRRLLAEIRRHPRPLVVLTTGDPDECAAPYLSELARRLLATGVAPVLAVRDQSSVLHAESGTLATKRPNTTTGAVRRGVMPKPGTAAACGRAPRADAAWPCADGGPRLTVRIAVAESTMEGIVS